MDVKGKIEQLKQLRYLKGEVILLSQRIERLEAEITGMPAADGGDGRPWSMGRSSSP